MREFARLAGLCSMVRQHKSAVIYADQELVNFADWDHTFSVNVRGTFLCYQYAAKQMIIQGRGGRIIGACSGAGKQGIWIHSGSVCSRSGRH